jgi:hypothetical protein
MSTSTSLATVAEFLKLQPPTAGHLEIHHGEIVHMPATQMASSAITGWNCGAAERAI